MFHNGRAGQYEGKPKQSHHALGLDSTISLQMIPECQRCKLEEALEEEMLSFLSARVTPDVTTS